MQQTIAKKLNTRRHKIALKKLSSPPIKIIRLPSNPPDIICIAPIIPFAKPEFSFSTDEIESTTKTFSLNSKKQEHNLIEALKIACRKYSKEKTGKKPFTNINIVKI